MQNKFKVILRTPQEELVDREVESVYLTTEEGDLVLMPGHSALAGAISYSKVILKDENHLEEYLTYSGVVFFSNTNNEARILVQRATLKDKVDYDGLRTYLKLVQERIANGQDLSDIHIRFLEGERVALVQGIEAGEK